MAGRKKSDERVRGALHRLGCPTIRRGQGMEEWERAKGSFAGTPDLIAGPLIGNGHPDDFVIDVFEPSGDPYVKLLAGNPDAAAVLRTAVDNHSGFTLGELRENYEHFFGPITKKLQRYSASRGGSPMVGVAMYFACLRNQYVGPVLAHLDAIRALDRAFGIEHHLGTGKVEELLASLVAPGDAVNTVVLPIENPRSFLLYVADKTAGQKVVLVVNSAVTDPVHPLASHEVLTWLRNLPTLA